MSQDAVPMDDNTRNDYKKSDLNVIKEKHRFCLSALLIGGFLVLVGISVYQSPPDPLVLSGIFSGWIVSIIGFYFLQQNVETAQGQAKEAIRKSGEVISDSNIKLDQWEAKMEEKLERIQSELDKKQKVLDELLAELEESEGPSENAMEPIGRGSGLEMSEGGEHDHESE
jgi:septin family protein